jgi:hypothetical protein
VANLNLVARCGQAEREQEQRRDDQECPLPARSLFSRPVRLGLFNLFFWSLMGQGVLLIWVGKWWGRPLEYMLPVRSELENPKVVKDGQCQRRDRASVSRSGVKM